MITCNSIYPCAYRFTNSGTLGYGCNYTGYCDYQCPRDSRFIEEEKEGER